MAGLEIKPLDSPDEVRPFADEKGGVRIVNLASVPLVAACSSRAGVGRSM
jgi:hypothetical protein